MRVWYIFVAKSWQTKLGENRKERIANSTKLVIKAIAFFFSLSLETKHYRLCCFVFNIFANLSLDCNASSSVCDTSWARSMIYAGEAKEEIPPKTGVTRWRYFEVMITYFVVSNRHAHTLSNIVAGLGGSKSFEAMIK